MSFVRPDKEEALKRRLRKLGVFEKDIEETFIRSGGRGGQHLNKTSTCVYLKHLPTGISVKCQKGRSQRLNRYFAREILFARVEQMIMGKKSEEEQRIQKIRRQKRKRSQRAKEKMLQDKKALSERKKERSLRYENDA
jgi:protein subunit release factor B